MRNPFRYGRRVKGESFFDRVTIKRDILNVLDGGNNVVLFGPRRYGKSSLVGEVLSDLQEQGTLCAEINMMDVASLNDFVSRYAKIVYRATAPFAGAVNQVLGFFKRVSPTIGLDSEGKPELKFELSSTKAGISALRDVLELPEKLCPEGKRMVIALDEFQEVAKLGLKVQFERTMRSVVENQEKVSYIYLGSKSHMLQRMFASKSRSFYNSAQKFQLDRPPKEESSAFVTERFKSVGLSISTDLSSKMVDLVGNVPYYIQALGSWTFTAVNGTGRKSVTPQDVEEGFSALYAAERILLENTFQSYSESQRTLLLALATEPTNRFDETYRNRHHLASTSTTNTALKRLLEASAIEPTTSAYLLTDPLMVHHLKTIALD